MGFRRANRRKERTTTTHWMLRKCRRKRKKETQCASQWIHRLSNERTHELNEHIMEMFCVYIFHALYLFNKSIQKTTTTMKTTTLNTSSFSSNRKRFALCRLMETAMLLPATVSSRLNHNIERIKVAGALSTLFSLVRFVFARCFSHFLSLFTCQTWQRQQQQQTEWKMMKLCWNDAHTTRGRLLFDANGVSKQFLDGKSFSIRNWIRSSRVNGMDCLLCMPFDSMEVGVSVSSHSQCIENNKQANDTADMRLRRTWIQFIYWYKRLGHAKVVSNCKRQIDSGNRRPTAHTEFPERDSTEPNWIVNDIRCSDADRVIELILFCRTNANGRSLHPNRSAIIIETPRYIYRWERESRWMYFLLNFLFSFSFWRVVHSRVSLHRKNVCYGHRYTRRHRRCCCCSLFGPHTKMRWTWGVVRLLVRDKRTSNMNRTQMRRRNGKTRTNGAWIQIVCKWAHQKRWNKNGCGLVYYDY